VSSEVMRREIQTINWHRAPVFFLIMVVLEPVNVIVFDLPGIVASSGASVSLAVLHSALFGLAVGALWYWWFWVRSGRWKSIAVLEAVTALIGTVGLSLTAATTVIDLSEGGSATSFLANILICSALALIPVPWAAVIYGLPTAVFFAGALLLAPPNRHLFNDLASILIFSVAAVFIARFQYRNQVGLLKKNADLNFLSRHDPLTGLANRSQFQTKLDWQLAAFRRSGLPSSLVLVDLDRFKAINDKWGHPVGDLVLKETARVFQAGVRDIDCVCRWGGEEFLILLVDTPANDATMVADRLRADLARAEVVAEHGPLKFTASFGVTELGEGPSAFQDAYARVDSALYLAKTRGRNRVEVNPRPLSSTLSTTVFE